MNSLITTYSSLPGMFPLLQTKAREERLLRFCNVLHHSFGWMLCRSIPFIGIQQAVHLNLGTLLYIQDVVRVGLQLFVWERIQ